MIAVHIVDDNFVQPQPGTSARDHLVSGLVPLAVLALAAVMYPRLSGGGRAAVALVLGVFGIVAGSEAVYYTIDPGPSGDDYTGLLSFPAGLVLVAVGAGDVVDDAAGRWKPSPSVCPSSPDWRRRRRRSPSTSCCRSASATSAPTSAGFPRRESTWARAPRR